MPARPDFGMKLAYGANRTTVSPTAAAEITPDHCVCAGLLVHRGASQRAASGEAVEQAACQIRHAFAQALLIDVQFLSRLRGDRFGHRDRLQQSQQRNGQRAAGQLAHPSPVKRRQFE